MNPTFTFKKFAMTDARCGMKIGTDGVLLGAWARVPAQAREVMDAGAGSALISLMLAQRYPSVNVKAVEIDPSACEDARLNVGKSLWAPRIEVINDTFDVIGEVDAIVSNPPFFLTGELSPAGSRAASRHAAALSPATLIDFAARVLPSYGSLSMISTAEALDDLTFRAALAGLYPRRICMVSTREGKAPARVLWEFSRCDGACEHTYINVRTRDNKLSEQYTELTKEFYL